MKTQKRKHFRCQKSEIKKWAIHKPAPPGRAIREIRVIRDLGKRPKKPKEKTSQTPERTL